MSEGIIKPGDGVRYYLDMGRGPLQYHTDCWRYGVEQFTIAEPETGWYAGWPAYTDRADAEASLQSYEFHERTRITRKYKYRIAVYPPEPPPFYWRFNRG